jgi:23S rRNA pseudouridine1911/1915/1917 synthase
MGIASTETQVFSNHHIVIHRVREATARLDHFLKDRYSRRSRAQLQDAIDRGVISVVRTSGQAAHAPLGRIKPSTRLLLGDSVHVLTERKPEPEVDFGYRVLFEDAAILVIEKPGNLPVHPAGRFYFNTLLIHMRTDGFTAPLEAEREFYLPHRIDRETSGVMVLTKTIEATQSLTRQFADRETRKRYLAIAHGHPEQDEFSVDLPLARRTNSPVQLQMDHVPLEKGGAVARTVFRVIERAENPRGKFSLMECLPETGRQHQIRVHLQLASHPIVGDKLYSLPDAIAKPLFDHPLSTQTLLHIPAETRERLILPRQALHAAGLGFTHPVTGKAVEFESDLPEALKDFLRTGVYRGSSSGSDSTHTPAVNSDPVYGPEEVQDLVFSEEGP